VPIAFHKRSSRAVALAGVFLLALSVRLANLESLRAMPFYAQPEGDGRSYWEWSARIAAGDWLGDEVFYQAPLYPYSLALVRMAFGQRPQAVYVTQSVVGSLACVVLAAATGGFFPPPAGVIAGAMVALYPVAVFYDGVVQKESLAFTLMVLLVWALGAARRRPGWRPFSAAGVALGLQCLLRENALILAPVSAAWMLIQFRRWPHLRQAAWALAFFGGMFAVLLPVGARNAVVGGEFVLTTAQMGPNFYIGNGPRADGTYRPLRYPRANPLFERQDAQDLAEEATGRPLSPQEVSHYWMRRTWDHISAHPASWAKLLAKKALLTWNDIEIADTEDFYFYRIWSPALRAMSAVWGFGVLMPLAAAGTVLTWQRLRRVWLLHALFLAWSASVALFYVFGRYRFPLVPLLAPLAAEALVLGWRRWRQGRRGRVAWALAAGLAAAALANYPVQRGRLLAASSFYNWGLVLHHSGQHDAAMEKYREALRRQPDLATAHFNLGNILLHRDRLAEAAERFRAAAIGAEREGFGYLEAWNNMGIAEARRGRLSEAASAFRRALEINPNHANTRDNLAALARVARERRQSGLAAEVERLLSPPRSHFATP
jgi:tetratricopeptide (TPR) repeat protein